MDEPVDDEFQLVLAIRDDAIRNEGDLRGKTIDRIIFPNGCNYCTLAAVVFDDGSYWIVEKAEPSRWFDTPEFQDLEHLGLIPKGSWRYDKHE